MFKIAVPWLALSNLGSVYRGFGCKHRNGSNNARRISNTEFLSPNVFKAILCITPLLLLLLPNTGDLDDSHENHKETEIVFLFVVAHDHRSVR